MEVGRCPEEAGPAGNSWDWGRGLKWPEKAGVVGGGARNTQDLGGEVRVSRQGSGWMGRVCAGGRGRKISHARSLVFF